jgi:hypothetical protein
MLVMLRVPLALVTAQPASNRTCSNDNCNELGHERRLSGKDVSGRDADVTAVQAERGAHKERVDIRLGKVGVCAGSAALGALEARVDASDQNAGVKLRLEPVSLQNLLGVGHMPSFLVASSLFVHTRRRVAWPGA